MTRLLSYTELSTALTCFAQWDFAYGGRLAGTTLRPREVAPRLSAGRAWGAGVAAWHASGSPYSAAGAIWDALVHDVTGMREKGLTPDPGTVLDAYDHLTDILDHYVKTTVRLPGLERLEDELNIPIPSRTGRRGSTRYRFHAYIDGHTTIAGNPTIVEFKLRDSLTDPELIARQPQYRWYAFAYALQEGIRGPVGMILDERLSRAPEPVHINKNGLPSHDKRQMVTPEDYLRACVQHKVKASPEALATFQQRQWGQRVELLFTPADLRQAASELVSGARLIRDMDNGTLYPIRNGKRANCGYCKFRSVCEDPTNHFAINALFERTEPKRLRPPRPEGVR